MTITHNHPPRCCCLAPPSADPAADVSQSVVCPACPEHWAFAAVECPSCHQPAGRPPTDYCRNRTWHQPPTTIDTGTMFAEIATASRSRVCAYPRDNHGDGRGCDHEDCPRHGHHDEDPGHINAVDGSSPTR